ncbi:MAG: ABC transporter substrate-binding protein [Desulfobulbaceae bacterium A2]|nr:MAG: ABC transporter substrate-binding protein [Desulfobulbaceae bacterium A2]
MRVVRHAVFALALAVLPAWAQAGTVTIVTSFPKELTQAYKAAFEKANPDVQVEVLNKGTTHAIAYVRELPAGQRPDVFWASAPDAFEVLSREKLLQPVADLANPEAPARIGNYAINDPDGLYLGQALAGYGLMWNTRYLKANKLAAPAEWADLVRPEYFGHLAVSAPSRSGTTHLTVETILQGEGWDKGWNQLLQIGGNCAQVTERSFGVPDGVNNGQFGIGLVIDFFGLAGRYSGFPVDFVYPTMTAVVPANIGLVNGAKNGDDGRKFIAFAMSQAGQELLLNPKISRLPILPLAKMKTAVPEGYPDIFAVAAKAKVQFDSNLSEARYYLVTALFDQTITFRLKELQAAAKAIYEAEKKLAGKKANAKASDLLRQARELAFQPVVNGAMAGDATYLELFTKNKKDAEVGKKLTELEDGWNAKARANYEKAKQLADQAAAL